jgi:hypothetical protein
MSVVCYNQAERKLHTSRYGRNAERDEAAQEKMADTTSLYCNSLAHSWETPYESI